MAFLGQSFNEQELPASQDFSPIPEGWYKAKIVNAEIKATKAGNGQFIAIRYDILSPTHTGRVVFGNINIRNPNTKAEEIGRIALGQLMRSIGLSKLEDTDQLISAEVMIKVSINKSETYGDSNDVRAFKSLSNSEGLKSEVTQLPNAKSSAPPWAAK
jgi:hypothetical protein